VVIRSNTALEGPLIATALVTVVMPLDWVAAAGRHGGGCIQAKIASVMNKKPLIVFMAMIAFSANRVYNLAPHRERWAT
jgi:hypothetical protein